MFSFLSFREQEVLAPYQYLEIVPIKWLCTIKHLFFDNLQYLLEMESHQDSDSFHSEDRNHNSYSIMDIDSRINRKEDLDLFEKLADSKSQHPPLHNPDQRSNQKLSQPTRCKCSKIGCLKLYCQCFTRGTICGKHCTCMGCENCRGNQKRILLAQQMANFRKPGSFFGVPSYVPDKKCTCKKSQCQKKYCECHSAGVSCGPSCQCVECLNQDEVEVKGDKLKLEVNVRS